MRHNYDFSVGIASVEEMVAVRAFLKAQGYRLFDTFEQATSMEGVTYVVADDTGVYRSSHERPLHYTGLQALVIGHLVDPNSLKRQALEKELTKLQARSVEIIKELSQL